MENHRKHSLGYRAFLLFFMKRLRGVLFFFAFAAAFWYSERWVPPSYAPYADYIVNLVALMSVLYFLAVLLWTWLEYHFYTYAFTEEAFVMTYGYIVRNELAALYHQIQNVAVQRSPFDRIAGVSKIVIYMNGAEQDAVHNKIVLPAVGKTKAKLVQKELLVRARKHVAGSSAENRSGGASAPDR